MTSSSIWILITSLPGSTIAAAFAGWIKLQRNVYLLFYLPLVSVLFIAFVISNDLNIKKIILHKWAWGLPGAVLPILEVKLAITNTARSGNKRADNMIAVIETKL